GEVRVPILALNVVYPLVPEEIRGFCAGKRAVLVVEEGNPEFIEQEIATTLRRGDLHTKLYGKDVLPMAGEYTSETILRGVQRFFAAAAPRLAGGAAWLERGHCVPGPARPP